MLESDLLVIWVLGFWPNFDFFIELCYDRMDIWLKLGFWLELLLVFLIVGELGTVFVEIGKDINLWV
jgi:hypothetical protein